MNRIKALGFILVLFSLGQSFIPIAVAQFDDFIVYETIENNTEDVTSYPYQTHSVFSNRTNLWYNFYYDENAPNGGAFMYHGVNLAGVQIIPETVIFNGVPSDKFPMPDFDIAIDPNGDRIIAVYPEDVGGKSMTSYTDPSEWVIGYILTNEETLNLDFVASSIFSTVDAPALGGWDWKNPDVEILGDGSIALSMASRFSGSSYGGAVMHCESTTNWDSTDAYYTTDDFYITLQGVNPPNTGTHQLAISPYLESGLAVFWRDWEPANNWVKHQCMYATQNLTTSMGLGTIVAGQWRLRNNANQQYLPDSSNGMYYFDINAYTGENITWTRNYADVTTTFSRTYVYHYNWTSDTTRAVLLIDDVPNERTMLSLMTNDAGSLTLWGHNETDKDPYIWRYNTTSETWGSPVYGENVNAPSFSGYASSQHFVSIMGGIYPCGVMVDGSIEWGWFLLEDGDIPYMPVLENETLTDSRGNAIDDNYLFRGEVYNLAFDMFNASGVVISVNDTKEAFNFTWDKDIGLSVSLNQSRDNLVSIISHNIQDTDNETSFDLTFILAENILDCEGVTFDYTIYSVPNSVSNWTLSGSLDLGFPSWNIYNLGEYTDIAVSNLGGKVPYGDSLAVWADWDNSTSYTYAYVTKRKLQHTSIKASLTVEDNDVFDTQENTGSFRYGIRYRDNQTWNDLYYVDITIVNGAIDPPVAGTGKAFVTYGASWNVRNSTGLMTTVKTDTLQGYPDAGSDVSSTAKTSGFYIDLWFDNKNSSTVIGGRFNTEYYGMDETGFILWTGWSPLIMNETFSELIYDMYDVNGNPLDLYSLDLIQVYSYVAKYDAGDVNEWSLEPYDQLNYRTLPPQARFVGIERPALVETQIIDMASSSFLSPLFNALGSLGKRIASAIAGVFAWSVGAVDTILSYLGFPEGFFSNIITYLLGVTVIFSTLMENLGTMITNLVAVITDMMLLLVTIIPRWVMSIDMMVASSLEWIALIIGVFTGEIDGIEIINLWSTLDGWTWVTVGFSLFPVWWFNRLAMSKEPASTFYEDVNFAKDATIGLVDFLMKMLETIQNIINSIMGAVD